MREGAGRWPLAAVYSVRHRPPSYPHHGAPGRLDNTILDLDCSHNRMVALAKTWLDLVEVNTNVVVLIAALHGQIHRSLVDTGCLWQLTVVLEISGLISVVFVDDVNLVILELT